MSLRLWVAPTLAAVLFTLPLVSVPRSASAQTTTPGFALDRYEPSERGSDWFVADSLDFRGEKRLAAGAVLDYAHDPLVLYKPDGTKISGIVSDQFFAHLGGAVTLQDRARLSLNVPVALVQAGDAGTLGSSRVASDNATALGDLRLAADVVLLGKYGDPASLALGVQFFVPTGSQSSFTGDGSVRLLPRAQFAGQLDAGVPLEYSAGVAFLYRASSAGFAGDPRGSEVTLNAAAGLRVLDRHLLLGPEIFGSAEVEHSNTFFAKHRTPFEIIFGGHYDVNEQWHLGAGVGPGLTRALGTPAVRGLLSVEWRQPVSVPPPPVSDRDNDKIIDPQDACPDTPGVPTRDPKTNGCPPPPPDRDHDTVLDKDDACPDDAGQVTQDPATNGCPDQDGDTIIDRADACPQKAGPKTDDPKTTGCPDKDSDKIIDDVDACPDQAGLPDPDPKKNGCPPNPDRDADGILNEQDACPDAAGPADKNPKRNGCPAARVEQGQIRILEQVQFAYNSAQILKASDFVLGAVAKILNDHPEIKAVRVEGHTDNKGGDAFNKKLSQKRAESVAAWLVKHGIAKDRLSAAGFGKEHPIDTNDTDEGRANNRRVEFHIEGQEPAPAAAATP